jgi:hypothetical protein
MVQEKPKIEMTAAAHLQYVIYTFFNTNFFSEMETAR